MPVPVAVAAATHSLKWFKFLNLNHTQWWSNYLMFTIALTVLLLGVSILLFFFLWQNKLKTRLICIQQNSCTFVSLTYTIQRNMKWLSVQCRVFLFGECYEFSFGTFWLKQKHAYTDLYIWENHWSLLNDNYHGIHDWWWCWIYNQEAL